ncbi:hypothetical protein C8R43DRAFT_954829 [Mycena crocata]|nr:hypothetical protein C8R43DRAFT_954829 [Mycena crocata]
MPRTTKTQTQADVLHIAETMMAASVALEDDPDEADLLGYTEEEADLFDDDIAEILDLTALNWMAIAQCMTGDGSRGTYDQIPKSVDFFSNSGICFVVMTLRNCGNGEDLDKSDQIWPIPYYNLTQQSGDGVVLAVFGH